MSVEAWCSQQGITKANYYYRLKRVRKACLSAAQSNGTAFVELPSPPSVPAACEYPGYTDLRHGIEGLTAIVRFQFHLDPYDKNTLFLFCGRRSDRIKALLWEGDGFLLMYKRLETGAFSWPRSADEAVAIAEEQYRLLM